MNSVPWMLDKVIEFISSIIRDDFEVFEWGSGGSTLYFANKVKKVVSVENDIDWFNQLNVEMNKRDINNVTLFFANYNASGNIRQVADPDKYLSGSKIYGGKVFEDYVKLIDKFDSFDLILVDGRARNSCVKHAIPKLKNNGYLIVDDSEREHYAIIEQIVPKNWKRTFIDGIKGSCYVKTSIYQKDM